MKAKPVYIFKNSRNMLDVDVQKMRDQFVESIDKGVLIMPYWVEYVGTIQEDGLEEKCEIRIEETE